MTSTTTSATTFVEAHRLALDDALSQDETVFLMGEDIADREGGGVLKVTDGLSTKYGVERVRSTPISEQAIMGAAVGSALGGMRPVAEIMLMNFLAVAMDQLFNHAAKLRFMSGGQTSVPLTVRTLTGAGVGFGAQHSDMIEAWLAHAPGLKVVMASSPADAYGLLLGCIFDDDPCVYIEHSLLSYMNAGGTAPLRGEPIPLGAANVAREGTDISIIGYGKAIIDALSVAEAMADDGVSIEVLDLRTIAPFDRAAVLRSVEKTRRAVVVHEAVRSFGVGAEIASLLHEELFGDLLAPVRRVGSAFCPVPFSAPLEQAYLYSAAAIEAAVRQTIELTAQ
jgi:pyruvate/2-oxoglutarate/acetoin dehydrogenase E1 component